MLHNNETIINSTKWNSTFKRQKFQYFSLKRGRRRQIQKHFVNANYFEEPNYGILIKTKKICASPNTNSL